MFKIKKNIQVQLFLAFIFVFFNTLKSQNWDSLKAGANLSVRVMYADTIDNYLYTAGTFYMLDHKPMKGIGRWNGFQWDSLMSGIDGMDNLNPNPQNTLAITRYLNKIYVGGVFTSLGDKPAISMGVWDGINWDTLSPQPFKTNYSATVISLEVIDNDLYIGGIFDSIGGYPCKSFAKWDGTNYSNIGLPPAIASFTSSIFVNAICKYNSEIYVGGNFESALYPNDTIQDIIRYDGTNWRSVGGGLKGGFSQIESMVVYNSELYVAGYFIWSEGNIGNCIQKWNGTSWSDVGGGVNGQIHKLIVYNGKLFALGAFSYAGGVPAQYIASWDGANWCGLGSTFDNTVLTGCVFNDSLHIGGGFLTIDSDSMHHVSKWIGGTFVTSCGNTSGLNESLNISNNLLNVFPNPTTSKITIEFELNETKNAFIEIKNVLGQTVKIVNNSSFLKGSNKIEINISELSNGLYFLQLQKGNKVANKKIIKQ